ncbi:hypothetical protein GXP67_17315 [Rhodocytophaga rosea]|uniref:Uncharacterized protein n=1 Tax=Rhodocytophaga rosea TaxID=2704465 RepID=A0A6C0GKC6_9BACT|nr:hypothetical protein [Rhodocytophaga rosea]QHT68274.1 hypothetical protein GXP67_17315 [Rhodocytophaga rosea]
MLLAWAQEQFDILISLDLNPRQRFIAASGLAQFKIDPTPIAYIPVIIDRKSQYLTFEQLAETVNKISIVILKSSFADIPESHHSISHLDGYALIKTLIGNFFTLVMNGNIPQNNNSIIDCLHRAILKKGKTPIWTLKKSFAPSHFGGHMDALIVSVEK